MLTEISGLGKQSVQFRNLFQILYIDKCNATGKINFIVNHSSQAVPTGEHGSLLSLTSFVNINSH